MQVRSCQVEASLYLNWNREDVFKISIFAYRMKEGKTKKIDELVVLALRQMGLEQPYREHEVCRVWPEVVGQMIASRTQSLQVVNGKLIVAFTSAIVCNEILMVKEGLKKALNDRVGAKVISDIIIR